MRTLSAVLTLLLFSPSLYPPETAFTSAPTAQNVPLPAFGQWIEDPVFHTRVTRISHSDLPLPHPYPKTQAWNADMSLLMFNNHIIDARNFSHLGLTDGSNHSMRWSHSDPRVIYGIRTAWDHFSFIKINITAQPFSSSFQELVSFPRSDWDMVLLGSGEGNLDLNDRYVALAGRRAGSDNLTAIVLDLQHPASPSFHDTAITWATNFGSDLDWISISPSGNYILVNWLAEPGNTDPATRSSVYRYDRQMQFIDELADQGQHGDMGLDAQGREVYVQFEFGSQNGIWKYDIASGARTRLLPDKYNGGHVSCRNNRRPGWCYLSTHAEGYREVFALKLDGSGKVNRFAQTHTPDFSAEGTVSPDGSKILFRSNWDDSNVDWNHSHEFVADVLPE